MLSKLRSSLYLFSKVYGNARDAVQDIKDNSLILVGGFGLSGIPMNLINAIMELGIKNITCVSNNCGYCDKLGKEVWGLAVLLKTKQIKRMIASYVGENA
jgi:acyl CoA:acetate/3-ketoacid CoA transferase alpha subunit